MRSSARPRCPLCGVDHAACAGAAAGGELPVDLPKEYLMPGPVRLYDVVLNGHQTQMRLNEEDAKRLGGTPVDTAGRHAADDTAPRKVRSPQNKARTVVPTKAAE